MARVTRAKATHVLMSPRKVRLVLDLVRDKYVDDAVAILKATPNRAARVVEKLVHSAASNAENNLQISREELKVSGAFADQGPVLKRIQPRAMGRAFRILKRSSHITVIVEESEPRPSSRRLARTVTKADAKTRRGRKEETKEPRGKKAAPAAEKTSPAAEEEQTTPEVQPEEVEEQTQVAEAEVQAEETPQEEQAEQEEQAAEVEQPEAGEDKAPEEESEEKGDK